MTSERLDAVLAERVMDWRAGPHRFMTGGRRWIPRWRFQPASRLEDALRLLEKLAPEDYSKGTHQSGGFWVKLSVSGNVGQAVESSQARAITFAIARALRIEVGQ
jgi:hypothetical protein